MDIHLPKKDHLKLIDLYLTVLSIPDLNFSNAKTCFDIIDELLKLVLILSLRQIKQLQFF